MFPQVPDPTAPPYEPGVSVVALGPVGSDVGSDGGSDAVLADLVAGNARFVSGAPRYGHSVVAARAAADRLPSAAVLTCMDARVPVEAIFDQDVGTLVGIRAAAHVLDRATLASVEFAVGTLGVGLLLVLGHSRCAAVGAAVAAARVGVAPPGNRGYVVEEIWPAVPEGALAGPDVDDVVTRRHTGRVAGQLRVMFGPQGVRVASGHYDVITGRVTLLG